MMTTTSAARCAPAAHLTARRARVANGRAVTVTPSQKSSVVFRPRRLTATTVASATKTPHSYAHTNRKGLSAFVERAAAKQTKRDLIPFRVGMTLRVGVTVKEGNKTRVQPYEGVVIAIHRAGVATTVTVRKTSQGFGVERVFPVHSPLCTFEEIRGAGKPVVRLRFHSIIRLARLSCRSFAVMGASFVDGVAAPRAPSRASRRLTRASLFFSNRPGSSRQVVLLARSRR